MLVHAYAKINLTLDIVGINGNGYHLLDSVFQSVGLYDAVTLEKADGISVSCEGINGAENIAYTAAAEFFGKTGVSGGVNIKIEKGIPLLSGLGGGSADAAAVIVALDRMYKTNLSQDALLKTALACGADVPFCLSGGTARVGGIGEKITPLSPIEGLWAVIVQAGKKESTSLMYKKLDGAPLSPPVTDDFLRALHENADTAFKKAGNAFGAVAANAGIIELLGSHRPMGVSLSGSGPSHFAVFRDKREANLAAKDLERKGFSPYAVPFVNRGNRIIE